MIGTGYVAWKVSTATLNIPWMSQQLDSPTEYCGTTETLQALNYSSASSSNDKPYPKALQLIRKNCGWLYLTDDEIPEATKSQVKKKCVT
jgi:hypothetical protein